MKYRIPVILSLAVLAGCPNGASRDKSSGSAIRGLKNTLAFSTNSACVISANGNVSKKIYSLAPGDTIVSVNGVSLTKRDFDDMRTLKYESLMKRKGMSAIVADKMTEEFSKGIPAQFVAQRLLVDQALRLKLVSTDEVDSHVASVVAEIAKKTKTTPEKLLASFGAGARKYFIYENAIRYAMDKIIKEKIPPIREVTPEFVELVRKQVLSDNAAAARTNNLAKVVMSEVREELAAGRIDFEKAGSIVTNRLADAECSEWGEFRKIEIEDENVAERIFELPRGEISEVLEDDDGYRIVRVLSVTESVIDAKGNIVEDEKRRIKHILARKCPMFVEEGALELSEDLKKQMQMQAIDAYVGMLTTNGENTVVWPYGKNLF